MICTRTLRDKGDKAAAKSWQEPYLTLLDMLPVDAGTRQGHRAIKMLTLSRQGMQAGLLSRRQDKVAIAAGALW